MISSEEMRTHEATKTAIYHNKAGIITPTVRHMSETSSCLVGEARDCTDAVGREEEVQEGLDKH